MSKVQPATTPASKRPAKQMYRVVIAAQAVADVFVRAASDVDANAAIQAGKGQRMKPRFSAWKLWQEAIPIDCYAGSTIPASEILRTGRLTEGDLGNIYAQVLHKISLTRVAGIYTNSERQAMADAVREFHDMATEVIRAKAAR